MEKPLIKRRKVAVAGIKDRESLNRIKEHLNKKTGMIAVDVESQKGFVEVKYDLRKINFETIEKSIKELGFSLSQKAKEKFKRGMAKFTEQNELDNVIATPSSCHEDPKEIRHKANR